MSFRTPSRRAHPSGCEHTRSPNCFMISIHALLTENALAEEFVSAFHARRLPEKFFYWFPLSVRAWLALCSDGAYRNFVRSRSLIARSAAELARLFPPGPLEVLDRKSTRLNSSHLVISYAVFCLKKKKQHYVTIHLSEQRH